MVHGYVPADYCVSFEGHSQLQNFFHVLFQPLPWNPVAGDAVTHSPPRLGECIKNSYFMAQRNQVIGCCQSGWAGTDNRHLLARFAGYFLVFLPNVTAIVDCRSFQGPDGDRISKLFVSTDVLTGSKTGVGTYNGKGNFLTKHRNGLIVLTISYSPNVTWYIYTCWTTVDATRDDKIFSGNPYAHGSFSSSIFNIGNHRSHIPNVFSEINLR